MIMAKELPYLGWFNFERHIKESSEACNMNEVENILRLRMYSKGLLSTGQNVTRILDTLRGTFRIPNEIIKKMIYDVRRISFL